MEFFLGLDGGGTGCRAVLADLRGHEIGRAEGGPANINSDPQGALDTLLCELLTGSGDVPALWRGALEDPDVRADLVEALAEAAEDSAP